MTRSREDDLLADIATLVVHLLPGGWELATLTYRCVGESHEWTTLGGGLADPGTPGEHDPRTAGELVPAEELLPRSGVLDLLRALRAHLADARRGAWAQMTLNIRCPVSGAPLCDVTYDWPGNVSWGGDVPPEACAEELRLFPRTLVPGWMRDLLALQAAADSFDEQAVLNEPQSESYLVEQFPGALEQLFVRARMVLDDIVHEASSRFLVGRLGDGCWSVLHEAPAWLAVRMEDGRRVHTVPFESPRDAVTWAMGGVMADAAVQINGGLLQYAGVIETDRNTWTLTAEGRRIDVRRRGTPRPPDGAYVALGPLHGRPDGYFVATAGPAPREGGYLTPHEIFDRLARRSARIEPRPHRSEEERTP